MVLGRSDRGGVRPAPVLPIRSRGGHFEDGTVNYLNLPAVEIGLRFLDRIGIQTIRTRVAALGAWLLELLGALNHSDGSFRGRHLRATEVGAAARYDRIQRPAPRLERGRRALRRPHRQRAQHLAAHGLFCNPGAGEIAFTSSHETLLGGEFGEGMTLDDYVAALSLHSGGAIRASLGLASNLGGSGPIP